MSQPSLVQACVNDQPVVLLDLMLRATSPESVLTEQCDNQLIELFRTHQEVASIAEDATVKTVAEQAAADIWGELYSRHVSVIYIGHYSNTRQRDVAEDLTQETFEKAMRGIHTYGRQDKTGNFGGWLNRISQNQRIDRAKTLTRRKYDTLVADPDIFSDCEINNAPSTEQEHFDRDFSDLVALIPEVFRDTVLLVDVHGKSYDEAAKQLDLEIGTVRSRLHRGRAGLRVALMELASNDSPRNPDDYLESIAMYYSQRAVAKKRRETDAEQSL